MAQKRKTKRNIPITEWYEIEIEGWEVDYRFGINIGPKDLNEGIYSEYSKLILIGRIILPSLEQASKARIEISGDPQMDDHWQQKPTII